MTSSPNKSNWFVAVAAVVALTALACAWWMQHHPVPAPPPSAPAPAAPSPSPHPTAVAPVPIPAPVVKQATELDAECDTLRGITDAATARQKLAALRQMLASMPTNAAVAAIRAFLDSKADAATHLGFKVAGNGLLDEAPTLRTFLLDELARLDPAAAADYARTILGSMDSPDEWAVALRNLARGDSSDDARALLAQKTGEMLRYPAWEQDPSVGFLEAFDVAVYLGGTDLMPTLSDMVRSKDNPAISHAAFLAMDRLVLNSPSTALAALQTDPSLMQGREATRADYFARADVRDPQQRQIIENYILNPQINPAELDTFAGIFPNANFMISNNLLTQSTTPDHGNLAARDAASLQLVQTWLADPRFANVQPALTKIAQRLRQFASQTKPVP